LDTKPSEELWDFQVVWRSQRLLPDAKPSCWERLCISWRGSRPQRGLPDFHGFRGFVKSHSKAQTQANLQRCYLTSQTLSSDLVHGKVYKLSKRISSEWWWDGTFTLKWRGIKAYSPNQEKRWVFREERWQLGGVYVKSPQQVKTLLFIWVESHHKQKQRDISVSNELSDKQMVLVGLGAGLRTPAFHGRCCVILSKWFPPSFKFLKVN